MDPIQKYEDLPVVADLAELFRALADSSRVRILLILLEGEQNITALAEMIGISEPAISHHMRSLRHLHIVSWRRKGREVFYCLADDHVTDLLVRGWEHINHG